MIESSQLMGARTYPTQSRLLTVTQRVQLAMSRMIWMSKDDKEPPKGFEKFFKKGETEKKETA